MAYVITEPCVATCDTACVDVCPVDAIAGPFGVEEMREKGPGLRLQLFIDPEICICCAACEPVCPVSAIYDEDDLPASSEKYRELNRAHFARR